MSVLLGVTDSKVEDEQWTDWSTNKIGGNPNSLPEVPISVPRCSVCGRPCPLVVQIYCPLNGSPYHRTLHVFACSNKSCWNKADSWTVLRSQTLDKAASQKKSLTDESDLDWGEGADDWGDPGDSEQTAMATTDWCDSADDWGEEEPELSVTDNTTLTKEQQMSEDLDEQADRLGKMALNEKCQVGNDVAPDVIADVGDDVSRSGEMGGEGCEVVEDCIAENMVVRPVSENLQTVLKVPGNHEQSPTAEPHGDAEKDAATPVLESHYINVFEAPSSESSGNYEHEKRLLTSYVRREGVDLDLLLQGHTSSEGGSGKEGYEKAAVKHGDRTFHKFTKHLQTCPQQVIRYVYGGDPIYIRPPGQPTVPPCPDCGQPRMYELQLMPALVPLLRLTHNQGEAAEFGTVIIYTCRQSCWSDQVPTPRSEHLIVQADPDTHLFR